MKEIVLCMFLFNNVFIFGQVDVSNTYYDVPLSYELQDYVREVCEEYEVDMEVILGIMKTESDFRHKGVRSKNNTNSNFSIGIMQLNESHIDWYGELTGLDNKFEINNEKNNILGGVLVYKFYKDYWERQGYEDEELDSLSLLSYNRGINGTKKYIIKNGLSHNYVSKVLDYKNNLNKV